MVVKTRGNVKIIIFLIDLGKSLLSFSLMRKQFQIVRFGLGLVEGKESDSSKVHLL